MFLCSIAGLCKGLDFTDSKKPHVELIGSVIGAASVILLFASLVGVIVFAIKLFALYLYGNV